MGRKKDPSQRKKRLLQYYRLVNQKKAMGISQITSSEIAQELHGLDRSAVPRDLTTFIQKPGHHRAGYNCTYLSNQIKKLYDLENTKHAGIVGINIPFLYSDELKTLGIQIEYISSSLESIDLENLERFDLLILTTNINPDEVRTIPDNIKGIYDFFDNDLSLYDGYVEKFDLVLSILTLWTNGIEKGTTDEF